MNVYILIKTNEQLLKSKFLKKLNASSARDMPAI